MAVDTETTPLLAQKQPHDQDKREKKWVEAKILLMGFIMSLSLSFTQVPMLYAFRLMTCDEFYKTHEIPPPGHDRCAVHEIEAETARQVTLVGTSTTIVVMVGGMTGIIIIQSTQLICLFGGPAGYMLVLNTFISEVVSPAQRTAVFGKLQGIIMFGTALGYLLGGVFGDLFGIQAPWEIAMCSMAFATLYAYFFLPYVPPPKQDEESEKKQGLSRFLGPAKMLAPQRWRLPDGRIKRHFGVPLLFGGIFTGVLATGYIPTLIQMFSTIKFGFGTKENGVLMSYYCVIRGTFLTFAFPHIIDHGRKWFATSTLFNPHASCTSTSPAAVLPPAPSPHSAHLAPPTTTTATTPTSKRSRRVSAAQDMEAAISTCLEDSADPSTAILDPTPTSTTGPASQQHSSSAFDLFFLKWSLAADGVLTGLAALCAQSWHVFAVATLLPLASGSASAAKSVMIDMCPAAQKADALGAISLVEMVATLSTLSVFGLVFSSLAEVGRPNLVFVCNAAVAVFATLMLLGCRFPPAGSERVDRLNVDDDDYDDDNENDDDDVGSEGGGSDSSGGSERSEGVERVVVLPKGGK
ncbi:major facilitator superfamily transporter [Diplodia corticola]|uniref:Major facilitator superfamily transporter n=1 Tax=Diplodia corticola TaxID=236234 RepID=A0A1J9RDP3_9PEZI|nr:major facilitator superfamily transporter [Diplodia corticola]OJD38656.1 major facilitator superfamily transporter [Diplodia corticola]